MNYAAEASEGRYELKFVAPAWAYHQLGAWLRSVDAFCRPYPPRWINNVYFDQFNYASYVNSIEGYSRREKVRYRWYGASVRPGPGQLEIKFRRNRLGWKRSYPVNDVGGNCVTWNQWIRAIQLTLPDDARYWLREYSQPILTNCYRRDYWTVRDSGIRVTIDRHLSVYDQRHSGTFNVSRPIRLPDKVVLELKGAAHCADVLSRLISSLPLSLTRHSKYCAGVDAILSV